MILERASKLRASSAMLRERRSQRDRTVVWSAHAEAINELAEAIETPRGFLGWLAERGGAVPEIGQLIARAQSQIARLTDGLARDPDRVLNGNLIANARMAAKQAADGLEAMAASAWFGYVELLPPPDAELYAALRDHFDLERLVREAEQQDRRYTELRSQRYLRTDGLRREFDQLMVAREATRRGLPDFQDDEIRAFVAAAARDGAPLGAVTPAVIAWLAAHGLTDTYVVRRRQSGIEGGRRR